MTVKKIDIKRCFFAALWLCLVSIPIAQSHPHMWIDLKSKIIIEKKSQVSAIYQEWLFDDFFSASLIEEASQDPKGLKAGIRGVVEEILDNLQPHDYFTLVKVDGQQILSNPIESFDVKIRENRVWLSFSLPIMDQVNITVQKFSYSIFDPTYYIEMLYFENETVTLVGDVAKGCSSKIVQPDPSTEAVSLSRSPSLDKIPDQSIGQIFAESVIIKCQ